MKIGKALRTERLNLKLTQEQMCKGIVSHPFYAKVESGKNRINAESLFEILASHHMNFDCKIKAKNNRKEAFSMSKNPTKNLVNQVKKLCRLEAELAGNGKTWQREGIDILLTKLGIDRINNFC